MRKKKKKPVYKPHYDVIAYTDGGCMVNPGGPGGYGVVILNKKEGYTKEYLQGYISSTNNRMEVMAIIRAIKETADLNEPIAIYSDSQYAINCASGAWQRNLNNDLWDIYDSVSKDRKIDYVWVRGHAGNKYNERCDELATIAMESDKKIVDKGYTGAARPISPGFVSKKPGGAMGIEIDIPKEADKKPEICSVKEYMDKYHVSETCARLILNFYLEGIVSFKAYAKIKTGGIDYWSYKEKYNLTKIIGSNTWNVITKYLDDEKQIASCAKWICRGLRPSDAIRKVLVDAEINTNNEKRNK